MQYNQTFCSHQLEILWAIFMLCFDNFCVWFCLILYQSIQYHQHLISILVYMGHFYGYKYYAIVQHNNVIDIVQFILTLVISLLAYHKRFLWQLLHYITFCCNSVLLTHACIHWNISKAIPSGDKLYRQWLRGWVFSKIS